MKKMKRKMTERMSRYLKYMDSDHWKSLRRQKLKHHPTCQNCFSDDLLHVHHVNYRDYYSCVTEDLVVLCELCHDDLHLALRIVGAQTEEYPEPKLFELIAQYRRGDLGTPKQAKRERKKAARRLKKEQKRYAQSSKSRTRKFTSPISRALNNFWKSKRGLSDLIEMRNQLSLLIDQNDPPVPDVVSLVLNHGLDRLTTVDQLE